MRASLQHFLTLWLTLVAALWLTRAAVSALLFQRADTGPSALFQILAVPLLQAAALAWATRPSSPPLQGRGGACLSPGGSKLHPDEGDSEPSAGPDTVQD